MQQKSKIADDLIIDPDKASAELCKRSLAYFVKEFWDVIIEDDLEWGAHMDIMCNEVQEVYMRVINREPKLYDLIINVPPGTSKSTIITVMAPAWSWTHDASLRHITGSYSDSLSTEHSVKSRDIIRSAKYKKYFPDVVIKKDEDNKTNYKTTKNGQRFATSVGGTVTGVHAHVITMDDPLNPKQAASQAELGEANKYFDSTLSTRKVDKRITPLILVMQRLDANDPTGHILEKKKKGVRLIRLPATDSANVHPIELREYYVNGYLDPVRLGQDVLDEMLIDLGSYGYAGQFDQMPAPPGGLIWQRKWFNEVPDDLFPDISSAKEVGTDWDLAYTKEDNNAASAYITSGKINERIYLFDFDWKWLEFPELIKWMKEHERPHYIEAKASGKSAKQTLSKANVTAIEIKIKGGNDKVARARMASPTAESGVVYIRKSMADKFFNDSKQGILFFPKNVYKDLADVLAQCLQRHTATRKIKVAKTGNYDANNDFVKPVVEDDPLDWINAG